MSDDWLNTEEKPSLGMPIPIELPVDPMSRVALAEQCWAKLNDKQRIWLTAFRDNGLNARKTERAVGGDRRKHREWMCELEYCTVVRIWLGVTGSEALDRDRLLARQDDIVETLLTPKPILHQGAHTGFEEVEAGAASRANEVLMKAAGLLKDKEIDVNVGIVGPSFTIQVVQPDSSVIDVTPRGVPVNLPEPEAIDAEWLDGP